MRAEGVMERVRSIRGGERNRGEWCAYVCKAREFQQNWQWLAAYVGIRHIFAKYILTTYICIHAPS